MNTKDEAEIAKEREAVNKMIGAKSAMEQSLQRISRLELQLQHIAAALKSVETNMGSAVYVFTRYGGENGMYTNDAKMIPLSEFLRKQRLGIEAVV